MFLNDEYTLSIDDLGYAKQASVIRNLIINADTPFSVGVSGRWGSGKTSMMKYLMASLGGKPLKHRLNFHTKMIEEKNIFKDVTDDFDKKEFEIIETIWFNPWEYENHNEPIVGLLQEIHNHFSFLTQSFRESKKLLSVAFESALNSIGSFFSLAENQANKLKVIGENYEYDNFSYLDRNQKFKFIFQEALETLLLKDETRSEPEDSARIVIFIDDLDRCEDETIAKLLKEIKQYLSTKRCVFVFGYDRHHIEKSLSKSATKTNKETRAYLEKLFQTTFYIKEPSEKKLKTFVKDILKQYELNNRDDLTNFIISIIDPNPRRLKSFLVTFYFHIKNSSFSENENIKIDDLKKLALITYLKLFYESVYSVLENQNNVLKNILTIFKHKDKFKTTHPTEYFIYLEFINYIHSTEILSFNDEELKKEIIKNDKNLEEKFLNEVYEMQGKYRSFENFTNEFQKHFENFVSNNTKKISKYL